LPQDISYEVFKATNPTGPWTSVGTTTDTEFTLTGLTDLTQWYAGVIRTMVSERGIVGFTTAESVEPETQPVTQLEIATYATAFANFAGNTTVADYAEAESSELWANRSAWSTGGDPSPNVSGGKLYSTASGGGAECYLLQAFGANKFLSVMVETPADISDRGYVVVGVSSSYAGGLGTIYGICLHGSKISRIVDGAIQDLGDYVQPSSKYFIEVRIFTGYICVSLTQDASQQGLTYTFATGTSTHFVLFNNDTATTAGVSMSKVDFKTTVSAMSVPQVPAHYSVIGSDPAANYQYRIMLPKGHNPSLAYPTVVLFHGLGTTGRAWSDLPELDGNYPVVAKTLLDAGYVCIGANAADAGWGNTASVLAYHRAFLAAKQLVNTDGLFVFANSMGGIESLNVLARGAISPVDAIFLTAATANLAANRLVFAGEVDGAYPNYAVDSLDHDPFLFVENDLLQRLRESAFHWVVASDDTLVVPATNTTAMHNRLLASGGTTAMDTTTGGHSFAFNATWQASMLAHFAANAP
jgi:pimeloyl-ACP methyl ester carboxylesterase